MSRKAFSKSVKVFPPSFECLQLAATAESTGFNCSKQLLNHNNGHFRIRCDSAETAEHLKSQIQALVDRPENIAKFDDIEQRLVEKGLLLPLDCGK